MKFFWFLGSLLIVGGIMYWQITNQKNIIIDPRGVAKIVENKADQVIRPKEKNVGYMAKYNFINLQKRENKASEIQKIGKLIGVENGRDELKKKDKWKGQNFESSAISFTSNGKKISGMLNVPLSPKSNTMPAIVMIRGFAENEGYFIGLICYI